MYLQEMFVPYITHAYMANRPENRQASKQASVYPIETKKAGAKLMYNARCYHARRGYWLQHS